jgi:hypothetical protein
MMEGKKEVQGQLAEALTLNSALQVQLKASEADTQQRANDFEAVIADLNEVLKQVRQDLSCNLEALERSEASASTKAEELVQQHADLQALQVPFYSIIVHPLCSILSVIFPPLYVFDIF